MAPAAGAETRTGRWGSGGTLTPRGFAAGPPPRKQQCTTGMGWGPACRRARTATPPRAQAPRAHAPSPNRGGCRRPPRVARCPAPPPGLYPGRRHTRRRPPCSRPPAAGQALRGGGGDDDGTAGRRRGPTLPASLPPTVRYSREITAQRVG